MNNRDVTKRFWAALVLCALTVLAIIGARRAGAIPLLSDHYELYQTAGMDGPNVSLVDQFDVHCLGGPNDGVPCTEDSMCPDGSCAGVPETPDLGTLDLIGNPVDKNCVAGCEPAPIDHPTQHLTLYSIPTGAFGPLGIRIENQFGEQTILVGNPKYLAVPAQKVIQPTPLPSPITFSINHYKCYEAQGAAPPAPTLTLQDQFGTGNVTVGAPFLFCNPVDKNGEGIEDSEAHLACYQITDNAPPFTLDIRNQFGLDTITNGNGVGLCVPSLKLQVSTSTATPVVTPTPTATPSPLRHYACYESPREAFTTLSASLTDELGPSTVTVLRRMRVCNPVDKNGEDPSAPLDPNHLTGYVIKQTAPRFAPITDVTVQNQFGTIVVDLAKPDYLLVPAAKSQLGPPDPLVNPAVDHFKCYRVRKGKTRVPGVGLTDQFLTLLFDVKKPIRLCLPVDKNGEGIRDASTSLMCYKGRQSSYPRFRGIDPVYVDDQFGPARTSVDHIRELCVPSATCAVATVDVAGIMNGAPIDNNPNVGGGLRVFSEKATAAGAFLNQVNVVAQITQAKAGKRVYFKSFDVDDPYTNAAPVDPNGILGDDNRGLPQAGTLAGAFAITDATGTATIVFSTTKQPGDNFKVAASCDRAYLNGVALRPADGAVVEDAAALALPTGSGKLTQMLTVWRKVHVEVDAMQAAAGNSYAGTVNAVTNVGLGFVTTNLANMEPGRLQSGRLDIPTVGAFPIILNTGSMIVTFGPVPAAAVGKAFTAYDDDDFNNNDGVAKKGDTGEALVAPDRGLVQDSDVPANNLFAVAYVRPKYDLANANPTPPFVLNQLGDDTPDVRALFQFDNVASNANDYWAIYMLGGYQAITQEDQDPDTEEGTFGRVDRVRGQGAVTYLELVSNHELAAVDRSADQRTDAACVANVANYKASFRNAETTAHEVGHLFGGQHSDTGLMSSDCDDVSLTFSDVTINRIRSTLRP